MSAIDDPVWSLVSPCSAPDEVLRNNPMSLDMTDKLKIEYRKTDSLVPYARNPRKNDPNVSRMMGALATPSRLQTVQKQSPNKENWH